MNLKGMTRDKQWEKVTLPKELQVLKFEKKSGLNYLIIQEQIAMAFKENRIVTNKDGSVTFSIGRDIEYKIHAKNEQNGKFSNEYYMKGKLLLKSFRDEIEKLKVVKEIVTDKVVTIDGKPKEENFEIKL